MKQYQFVNICVSGVPKWKERVKKERKTIWKNNGQNFSKFDDNDKSTNPRSSTNPKHKKHKTTPKHLKIKVLWTSVKEIILKVARGKKHFQYMEIKITVDFMSENEKIVEHH